MKRMKKEHMVASLNPDDVTALLRRCAQEIVMPYRGNLKDDGTWTGLIGLLERKVHTVYYLPNNRN